MQNAKWVNLRNTLPVILRNLYRDFRKYFFFFKSKNLYKIRTFFHLPKFQHIFQTKN